VAKTPPIGPETRSPAQSEGVARGRARPEYVKCVAYERGPYAPVAEQGRTWCGRENVGVRGELVPRDKLADVPLDRTVQYNTGDTFDAYVTRTVGHEFVFLSADHALGAVREGSRLLICAKCAAAMRAVLAQGTDDGGGGVRG
jgi:hypothetical protein